MSQGFIRYRGGLAPAPDPVGATVPIQLPRVATGTVLASEIAEGNSLLASSYIRTDWQTSIVWVGQKHKPLSNDGPKAGNGLKKASKFGIRRTLLEGQAKPRNVEEIIEQLHAKLTRGYSPKVDYLLAGGDPLVCSLAFALAINIAAGHDKDNGMSHIKTLHWDDQEQDYEVVLIPIGKLAQC